MKSIALLLALLPMMAQAELLRCEVDGKILYQESGCVGKKMNMNPDINVVSAPRKAVEVASPPVAGAYYGYVPSAGAREEPVQYIRSYAGPRYYHDHGPPTYGGTGKYSPYGYNHYKDGGIYIDRSTPRVRR